MREDVWRQIALTKGFKGTKEMLEELYTNREMSVLSVGLEIGCSYQTILRLLKLNGIETRPRSGFVRISKKELKNMSADELAAKYKISRSAAWRKKKGG